MVLSVVGSSIDLRVCGKETIVKYCRSAYFVQARKLYVKCLIGLDEHPWVSINPVLSESGVGGVLPRYVMVLRVSNASGIPYRPFVRIGVVANSIATSMHL